ncbi:uncharacterized protein LOC116852901 isoform X3 [Odontomachus brunneus]|uniref:uncharacterized protein LOC116852901 isoform X3 n=1 Tax=Odontomachus brunneus TaxID=486640 RepID=UPI0013F2291F|nr:uncharacterized protein LOC116852901 isoform X3 [Odontomachus brunneus]
MMSKFARIAKRLVTVCATFMFTGAIVFRTILPLSQGDIITEQNVTIRPLACPSYLIFIDVQVTPIYEIYFTIQFVSGLITASIATGACGLTAIFVIHASGQMRILRDLMTTLVEEQKEYEVNKKLADIVEHQVRVRGFLRMVHHTLQEVFLMEMMEAYIFYIFARVFKKNEKLYQQKCHIYRNGRVTTHQGYAFTCYALEI